jgi:heme A synthase
MQVSSQDAPVARRWAQNLYLVLASLILLGIFLQGFLIGAFLFGGAIWGRNGHSLMGLVLLVLSLLLPLVGLLAQVPGRMKVWGFLLFVLVFIQMVLGSIGGNLPLLAALHPANAMVLFGLSLFLIFRIRQVMRAND